MSKSAASGRALHAVIAHLRDRGLDPDVFLRSVRIDPRAIYDAEFRVSHEKLLSAWTHLEGFARDPHVGLSVAQAIDFERFRNLSFVTEYVVAQLFITSATIGEGLSRMVRFYPVTYGSCRFTFERRMGTVRVGVAAVDDTPLAPHFVEFSLASTLAAMRTCTAAPVQPRRIHFRHAEPAETAEHTRVLRAPLKFGARDNAIILPASVLDAPFTTANASLATALERRCEDLLARSPAADSFADRVRSLIAAELETGNPSAEQIADAFRISVRTLGRRLSELGTSHQSLLDGVRAELARKYLVVEKRPVADVAPLLGFSETSAFHRAFRRWYGCSPTQWLAGAAADDTVQGSSRRVG